ERLPERGSRRDPGTLQGIRHRWGQGRRRRELHGCQQRDDKRDLCAPGHHDHELDQHHGDGDGHDLHDDLDQHHDAAADDHDDQHDDYSGADHYDHLHDDHNDLHDLHDLDHYDHNQATH